MIEANPHIKRHEQSNAILNTDVAALNKYKMERKLHRQVAQLSKEVEEIKEILSRVCKKLEEVEKI